MNVLAIGGGGFTHQSDALLEDYLLSLVDKNKIDIGFLATASDESKTKISRFYERFEQSGKATHLSLAGPVSEISDWVLKQDIIYVGGGNTKNMLDKWHARGLPDLLNCAAGNGTVLAGVSAGAVCWFCTALSDSAGSGLQPLPCLGMLNGSCCPHFDEQGESNESSRRRTFVDLISSHELPSGVGIDDGVAVHYHNGKVFKVVSARAQATAYAVDAQGKATQARAMETEQLA